jgi:glycosyltransferase involved in cell wall biosynthesis
MDLVSVIMPCYKTGPHIARAVHSVLAQTYENWELVLVSDDEQDYQKILAGTGITDPRIRHALTGKTGSGAAAARNTGMDQARGEILALLDSDDEFKPGKLELCVPALTHSGIVSCGLEIRDEDGNFLREAGIKATNSFLQAKNYKSVNISGDTILVFDRNRIPARYDESVRALEDLDFVLRCFEHTEHIFHVESPLHIYYKMENSVSHSDNTGDKYKLAKESILYRLKSNHYKFKDSNGAKDWINFLEISLDAENIYWERKKTEHGILFEDVLEKTIRNKQNHIFL